MSLKLGLTVFMEEKKIKYQFIYGNVVLVKVRGESLRNQLLSWSNKLLSPFYFLILNCNGTGPRDKMH